MFTHLRFQGFKSWQDTGPLRLAPLTGFFGVNSAGKTALLQALLLLKQTVESTDRTRVLHLGDERTYVDLGTFYDVIFGHEMPGRLAFDLTWTLPKPLRIPDPEGMKTLFRIETLRYTGIVHGDGEGMQVASFAYQFQNGPDGGRRYRFGMEQEAEDQNGQKPRYNLVAEGYEVRRTVGRPGKLPPPMKCYGFPDQVNAFYQNVGFLADLTLAFEEAMQRIYYLGPLREYPHRIYVWAGEQPQDVGQRGELAVHALLGAERKGIKISPGPRKRRITVTEQVARWLRDLGLIHSFEVRPIAENRKEYEVRVRRSARSAEVALTDVGFGVSQILPVLTLCYYAPEGSTLILEQPEIHLHPSVQAGLADVFIDAIRTRKIQIILESHSEHLLRRLQRRIAEEKLRPDETALYFIDTDGGKSEAQALEVDLFGNIHNWPANFFGDEMGDLVAMTEAAMARQVDGEA
ncbi:MAG: hypothetical protein KatS3mg050_0223 [Litorilinea sp.]|nr:MAG: hypothetical protein KatS3mg050_0223 [Litorilinea sp.]